MFVRTLRASRAFRAPLRYVSNTTTSQQVPANDPVERAAKPNVSETNAMETSSEGSFDKVLQENVADGERFRTQQAPNYKGIWSRSQQPREVAMSGPRFEQSIMEDQVSQNLFEEGFWHEFDEKKGVGCRILKSNGD
jgi:NADH dehydrogenase (ubiquinone) Fe-S protein 6